MPRPRKWRKVCCMPENNEYGPIGVVGSGGETVIMTVDEYETIRLIDLEGFTQEEAANQMDVARTTVQGIYAEARRKLAESLIEGKVLHIAGGEYKICSGQGTECHRGSGCRRRKGSISKEENG